MPRKIALLTLASAALAFAQPLTFSQKNSYNVGTAPGSILTADFNGDGKPDLATMDIVSFSVSMLLGNGDGTFKAVAGAGLPCQPVHFAAADFNKDGKTDILVICIASPNFYVLPGRGDGTFLAPVAGSAPVGILGFLDYLRIGIGDFNGDGTPDLAFFSFDLATANTSVAGNLYILPGRGNGTFGAAQIVAGVTGSSISVGDFNRDGKADLAISMPKNLTLQAINGTPPGAGPVVILLGNGDGTFKTGATYNLAFGPGPVAVGDVNGDGIQDLVVNGLGGGLAVLLGKGDGTFTQSYSQTVLGGGTVGMPVLSRLRGAQTPDIALPYAYCCKNAINFLGSNGDGTFQAITQFSTGISSTSLASADFDGDGRPDIAAVSFPPDLISLTNLMNYVFHTGGPGPQPAGSVAILINTNAFPVRVVNAASFAPGGVAAESIATAFGAGLAANSGPATTLPLPTLLNGASLTVIDAAGASRAASLFYTSPQQINFEIPAGTVTGNAAVRITVGSASFSTTLPIVAVAPGVFALNAQGLCAAQVLRVHPDSSQSLENIYQVDASGNILAASIDFGDGTDQIYLLIYATGVRNAKSVAVSVGGASIPVLFAGPQSQFAGEDQINVGPLPPSLAGQSNAKVVITADGIAANTTSIAFK